MTFQRILAKVNPKKLFLLDSLGALLTAFMLGLVLARLESTFGMPPGVLYVLSFIAGIYCIYSFWCYLRTAENWRLYMKIIAIANLLYCCVSAVAVIFLYQKLTSLGLIYFALEILIIAILAAVELKTASNQLIAGSESNYAI